MKNGGARSLYLCYFGLREPLVQTQVLPYLRQLRLGGVEATLLTFEPDLRRSWSREQREDWEARLRSEGIRWFALPYHKRPSLPATVYDILAGGWFVARLARREKIDVLHARAHVAGAMGALAKRASGARLLFDIRGFNAEECVDAGRWPDGGLKFRLTKRAERAVLAAADGFVVLTDRARQLLFPGAGDTDAKGRPVEVIPCCVDLSRFAAAGSIPRDQLRAELGLEGRRVLVYAGALGGWYMSAEMAEFFAAAVQQDPSSMALVLTQSDPELIAGPLRERGLSEGHVRITRVSPADVPRYLRASDLALSFIKPCYSKISSSPTKIAEYLASGLPVVSTAGIGDVDEVLDGDRVGVLVREFNASAYAGALDEVERLRREPGVADRCRASAAERFDLETVGGPRYRRLYQRMIGEQLPLTLARVP